MRIVQRNEGVTQAINELIAKLESDLKWEKAFVATRKPTLIAALEHKIEVLKQIKPNEPIESEANEIIFTEGYSALFNCEECGSEVRPMLYEFGSDNHKFRVCGVCLVTALEKGY